MTNDERLDNDHIFDGAARFQAAVERAHRELPREVLVELLRMPPGPEREALGVKLLPVLIRMAANTIRCRWRTASRPPRDGAIVCVHASPGGFVSGWYSQGRWYTHDHVDDGTVFGSWKQREINVREWRYQEGCLAHPWHDHPHAYPRGDEFDDLWPPEDP